MTILESHRVLVGASGWLHENWQEQFYPEDLPEEWQLGYYGNEFPVVLIRDKEWQQGGAVEDWLEETDELPLFICEIPLQECADDLLNNAETYLQAARELGERCIGILCRINSSASEQQLEALLLACQTIAPTVVSMRDADETIQPLLSRLAINPVWESNDISGNNVGSLFIAELDASQFKLPELRGVIEKLLKQQSPESRLVLLINGATPDMEMMKQVQLMIDLL
jgi:hypothetical protein